MMSALCSADSRASAFIADNGCALLTPLSDGCRDDGGPALQQMLQRDPQGVAEERHHHMGLHTRLQLMEQGPDGQFAFQGAEGSFGFGQLHVLRPEFFGRAGLQIGA